MNIEIEFDPTKNQQNIKDRGLSFDLAINFDWDTAIVLEDTRKDYGEPRYSAIGFIENRLYVLVFTPRNEAIRVISLRKANDREVKRYDNHNK
jgi:uncharacterized DUF497 family protein